MHELNILSALSLVTCIRFLKVIKAFPIASVDGRKKWTFKDTFKTAKSWITIPWGPYNIETSPVQGKSADWFLYYKNLHYERIRQHGHDTIQSEYVRNNQARTYLPKVNDRDTRIRCEIC